MLVVYLILELVQQLDGKVTTSCLALTLKRSLLVTARQKKTIQIGRAIFFERKGRKPASQGARQILFCCHNWSV